MTEVEKVQARLSAALEAKDAAQESLKAAKQEVCDAYIAWHAVADGLAVAALKEELK